MTSCKELFGKSIQELTDEEMARYEQICDQQSKESADKWPTDDEGITKALEDIPFFSSSNADNIDGIEGNELFEALKALKAENTLEMEVRIRKDRGNDAFARAKKLKLKENFYDAIDFYTEALELKGNDKYDNSRVYSNRALVHLTLKNYGHCINDCLEAVSLDPTNIKGFFRAADAAFQLGRHKQSLLFCVHGLKRAEEMPTPTDGKAFNQLEAEKKALDTLRSKVSKTYDEEKEKEAKKAEEKNAKEIKQTKVKAAKENKLSLALGERGIKRGPSMFDMSNFQGYSADPYLDDKNNLHWPVLMLYEEALQSDFIQDFHEATSFLAQLKPMMYPKSPYQPWDTKKEYRIRNIKLEVELVDKVTKDTYRKEVPLTSSLSDIINYCDFTVPHIPTFIVLPIKKAKA